MEFFSEFVAICARTLFLSMLRNSHAIITGSEKSWITLTKKAKRGSSTKFAALSINLQLIPPIITPEENEILEDLTIEIAENFAAVAAKKAEIDAIAATNDDSDA